MKTVQQMVGELKASDSEYVTYGNSDIGIPIKREDAIRDILSMDDDMIGEGTWYECTQSGEIKQRAFADITAYCKVS